MATDNDIYTRYRKGLIQRHIAKNGRLLEGIWLVEDGGGTSLNSWKAIRRNSIETLENRSPYAYNAYPLLVADQFYDQPRQLYLAGGGDNPLLMGGLAMAVFAIESLLNVSSHSLDQAQRLLDFFYLSQVGGNTGFFTRKRHYYRRSDQFSMDEICGMLVGLLYLSRAASQANQPELEQRVSALANYLGRFLKENQYLITAPNIPGRGNPKEIRGNLAFVFQYPFTRTLVDLTGQSCKSGKTFPDDWDDPFYVGEIVTFLRALTFDFDYTPRDLFADIVGTMGGLYNITDENLFNATMMVYCLLMVIDTVATKKTRQYKFAKLGNDVLKAVSYDSGILDGAKKPFRHNCLFAVVAKRCAELCVDSDSEWHAALDKKIGRLQDGDQTWFPDLPLGTPSDATSLRFNVKNPDGKLLWGGWYAWTADGTESAASFMNRPSWDISKTVGRFGPSRSKLDQVSASDVESLYSADPSRGFRGEASGVDFLIARALASYFGYLPKPELQDGDPEYESLPVVGPLSDGFLANPTTGEVHDLSVGARGCFLYKLLGIPKSESLPASNGLGSRARWFDTYWQASTVHQFNNCAVCLPSLRQYEHACDVSVDCQYVANKRSNEIHSKDKAVKLCNLDGISEKNILYYKNLDDALLDGLDTCGHCLGDSDH